MTSSKQAGNLPFDDATSAPKERQQKHQPPFMFGAIVGDIAGSVYEVNNCKSENCRIFAPGSEFTDDTVLTLATAEHLLRVRDDSTAVSSYTTVYKEFARLYPWAGYGGNFNQWFQSVDPKPYNSWGNGSAMRVSPIGWMATDLDWCLAEAAKSAAVTHNHVEGVKGAQAVAAAIFLARQGKSRDEIRAYITKQFNYDLDRTIEGIRPNYTFDVSCQGSVPEAIIAFLESVSFEDAIRKAISLGGDSDTIACITGAIAQAFYGEIPPKWVEYCRGALDASQLKIVDHFWKAHQSMQEKKDDSNEKA